MPLLLTEAEENKWFIGKVQQEMLSRLRMKKKLPIDNFLNMYAQQSMGRRLMQRFETLGVARLDGKGNVIYIPFNERK